MILHITADVENDVIHALRMLSLDVIRLGHDIYQVTDLNRPATPDNVVNMFDYESRR